MFSVQQGGSLFVDVASLKYCNLIVSTAWIDHCEIFLDKSNINLDVAGMDDVITNMANEMFNFEVGNEDRALFVTSNSVSADDDQTNSMISALSLISIHIKVPEYFSVHVNANQLNLKMTNKLMGNFTARYKSIDQVPTTSASAQKQPSSIVIDKIKGHMISIASERTCDDESKGRCNSAINDKVVVRGYLEGEDIHVLADEIQAEKVFGRLEPSDNCVLYIFVGVVIWMDICAGKQISLISRKRVEMKSVYANQCDITAEAG